MCLTPRTTLYCQAAYQRFVRRHSERAIKVELEGETTKQKEAKERARMEAQAQQAKITAGRQRLVFMAWLNLRFQRADKQIVVQRDSPK